MTIAELERSDYFRSFMDCWLCDRRPPLPFVDYLLELDCPWEAEAVRWVASAPDREVYFPLTDLKEREMECAVFTPVCISLVNGYR